MRGTIHYYLNNFRGAADYFRISLDAWHVDEQTRVPPSREELSDALSHFPARRYFSAALALATLQRGACFRIVCAFGCWGALHDALKHDG